MATVASWTIVAAEVGAERRRQDEKWGEQNHPNGTGPAVRVLEVVDMFAVEDFLDKSTAAELAEAAKQATDSSAKKHEVTWLDILLEEVFEAFAEQDPVKLRTELIQVAAVAQQWVEAIDRRGGGDRG